MRVLITGGNGFVGRYVQRELDENGHDTLICDAAPSLDPSCDVPYHTLDVRDADAVAALVKQLEPDACIHLAGIAFVPDGAKDPDLVLSVNIRGTLNILEAFRQFARDARILLASTSHVYGMHEGTVTEDTDLRPVQPYGISKAAADLATLGYAARFGMNTMTARPNNHTGAGQAPRFVVPAFAAQVARIAAGGEPVLRVGNLESERELMHVRDVARAYRLLLEKGETGRAYNVSSSVSIRIGDILTRLCEMAGISPRLQVDSNLYRPTDHSPQLDISRIRDAVGWEPATNLDETLRDVLDSTTPAQDVS